MKKTCLHGSHLRSMSTEASNTVQIPVSRTCAWKR